MTEGKVLWLTGLSGSGKTTLALKLEEYLRRRGHSVYILDGDEIRKTLCKDLGYSEKDRDENQRRIAQLAREKVEQGHIVIVSTISPLVRHRIKAESIIHPYPFYEVYLDTPLSVCEKRDPKGMYEKARQGRIKNFTGISSDYQVPLHPDIVINQDMPLSDILLIVGRTTGLAIL